MTSVPTILLK